VTEGRYAYAVVLTSPAGRSQPFRALVDVPALPLPAAPTGLSAVPASGAVRLSWEPVAARAAGYCVYRQEAGAGQPVRLTQTPIRTCRFSDRSAVPEVAYRYTVRAVNRRNGEGGPSVPVEAQAVLAKAPVFALEIGPEAAGGVFSGGERLPAALHGKARLATGVLDVLEGGHVTVPHREEFDLVQPLTLTCWVRVDRREVAGSMPVLVGCGLWSGAGWFVQWLGNHWRWYAGGVVCDGGQPECGRWFHLAATVDGQTVRLFQNGQPVAEATGDVRADLWSGDLFVGTYGALPGEVFQTNGQLADLRLYHRVLPADEIARAAQEKPAALGR
jgi:hypothetical protein